nr:hypothetical protein [Tanacetum cinerariifolium]
RLSKNVHQEHCHQEARGRPSTGSGKLQKKLNLTKPNTYRTNLRRREAYTAHSNPRGFIYQNKDKKNRLMRIDELHKFSDGTLNDVRNALDDCLKGIRMQYLSATIWIKGDKDRAATMIQAIEKMLKTRRIMRNLEKFVGGRLNCRLTIPGQMSNLSTTSTLYSAWPNMVQIIVLVGIKRLHDDLRVTVAQ